MRLRHKPWTRRCCLNLFMCFLHCRSKNHLGNRHSRLIQRFLKSIHTNQNNIETIFRLRTPVHKIKAIPRNYRLMPLLRICLHLFRHTLQLSSAEESLLPSQFVLSDEKSGGATAQQALCIVRCCLKTIYKTKKNQKGSRKQFWDAQYQATSSSYTTFYYITIIRNCKV